MKLPEKAPDLEKSLLAMTPDVAKWAMERMIKGEASEDKTYWHWEDLQYRSPPEGLPNREAWWSALQWQRLVASRVLQGLLDKKGDEWRVVVTSMVQVKLSWLDRQMAIRVMTDKPDRLSAASRDQFVVEYLTQEAWASSFIEGAAATREQAREMVEKKRNPRNNGERMVLNNYRALNQVREWRDQPLTPEMVLQLQAQLVAGTDIKPDDVGKLRLRQVVVATPENDILHEPPSFEELPKRLKALCDFANAEDALHPIVRAVALHFMLAYDHPFGDGNGRTARALFYWSMLRSGYALVEFMPISDVIRRAHAKYGRAFLRAETDNQDFTHFLAYHLEILEKASQQFTSHVADRRARETAWLEAANVPGLNGRQQAVIRRMLAGETKHTSFDAHMRDYGVTYLTARKDLEALLADGYLVERAKEGRRRLFAAAEGLAKKLK